MPTPEPTPPPSHGEIVSSRVLRAPRERVFRAFADPAVLAAWWGPSGSTNEFHVFDLRPGGAWRFVMRGPDGAEYRMVKEFVEVVAPERIVVRHLEPPEHRFTMITTFAVAAGGRTALTWRMRFDSAAEHERVKDLVTEANERNLDRLEAALASS